MVDTYKANRETAPDILREQMGLVRQVVDTLQLPVVTQAGLRGRRHHRHAGRCTPEAEGDDVIIVTGDRDSYQLVRGPAHQGALQQAGRVRLRPLRRGGHRRAHRRHAASSTSSTPPCGATRPTTCPGVPGVGEKTAAKLINNYGELDGHLRPRRRADPEAPLEPHREPGAGPVQPEMMRLVRDVPLEVDPDDLVPGRDRPGRGARAVQAARVPVAGPAPRRGVPRAVRRRGRRPTGGRR